MDRKLIINLCTLVALICVAWLIMIGMGPIQQEIPTEKELEIARQEGRIVEDNYGEERIEGWKPRGVSSGAKILVGIVLILVVATYSAIIFGTFMLPNLVHRFTHLFYGSSEEVEADPMHDARAFLARGDYEGAIAAYRAVALAQPENRFPWVEIAKIQHDKLDDCDASIETLRTALESRGWRVNDMAFFMFRLAELYEVDKEDKPRSVSILEQVVELFPETRHSANATHRLRELGVI
ncbi:MAG: tetratricopeptide repeat protein [Roseibacillus sp.]